jgi:acyl dehydratase
MQQYEVTARNPATDSENRIHADDVARRYGFSGGLVPGVTVYAYSCAPIVERLGAQWLERGTAKLRFVAPCYDGEHLTVTFDHGTVQASVGDRLCASGTASLDNGPQQHAPVPWQARPDERPPASEGVFSPGRILGSIRLPTDGETIGQYLEAIEEPASLYRDGRLIHPGMLLNGANWVLAANIVMPAWIHAESEIEHHRAVSVGEPVQVRARVAEAFERKGHQFATVEVDWVAGVGSDAREVVASGCHTFIWRLAGA